MRTRVTTGYGVLAALLLALLVLNLCIGTVSLSADEILRILTGQATDNRAILWEIRLPRLLAACVLGGALAVAGFLLQTFFANPIAGPFVLGISSGAKLTVALAMIVLLGNGIVLTSAGMVLAAFAGSMLSMGVILLISRRTGKMSFLIICGVMIGYICSAITEFAVTFADDSNIVNLHNWSMGSFSGIRWEQVAWMSAITAVCMVCALCLSKSMHAFRLGEEYARSMGVRIGRFKVLLILLSSVLSATVTAFAGPISFVGIAVPHLMKQLFGTAKPIVLLPAAFLGGSVFCLFCDLLARTVFAPTELSISAVTAVFGAPVVLAVMLRRAGKRG